MIKKTDKYINYSKIEHSYNSDKLVVQESHYIWDKYTGKWHFINIVDFEYDEKLLKHTIQKNYYAPSNIWINNKPVEYCYNKDTVTKKESFYNNIKKEDWPKYSIKTIVFDKN